LTNNGKRNH